MITERGNIGNGEEEDSNESYASDVLKNDNNAIEKWKLLVSYRI